MAGWALTVARAKHRALSARLAAALPLQGLAGCPFDPMAEEGTRFLVTFWVWDSASPPANATVARGVTLTKACPLDAAPYLCARPGGGYQCKGAGAGGAYAASRSRTARARPLAPTAAQCGRGRRTSA